MLQRHHATKAERITDAGAKDDDTPGPSAVRHPCPIQAIVSAHGRARERAFASHIHTMVANTNARLATATERGLAAHRRQRLMAIHADTTDTLRLEPELQPRLWTACPLRGRRRVVWLPI